MREQVYFAAADGRIKVGSTKNLATRIAAISSHLKEPLTLIGHIPGGLDLERAIQSKLKAYRLKGEWFTDCEEVRRFIRNILLGGPKVIGFDPKPKPTAAQRRAAQPKRTDAEFVAAWARVVRLVWPNDAVRELAAFTGYPEADCREWLEERAMPPKLVRYAFAGLFALWFGPDEEDQSPTFVNAKPEVRDGTLPADRSAA